MSHELELFFKTNNIKVLPRKEIENGIKEIKFYNPNEYICMLSEIHNMFLNEEDIIKFKFRNDIWKQVQIFKLWYRRAEKIDINNRIIKLTLETSKKNIELIENMDYRKLIRRAMDREEVCIGKIYYSFKESEKSIFIKNIDGIRFDMIENDYYGYLKKIRSTLNDDLNELIKLIIEEENLEYESYIYIKALLEFPYNAMKYLQNTYIKDSKVKVDVLEELLIRDYIL